jgi:hypothetical protein
MSSRHPVSGPFAVTPTSIRPWLGRLPRELPRVPEEVFERDAQEVRVPLGLHFRRDQDLDAPAGVVRSDVGDHRAPELA